MLVLSRKTGERIVLPNCGVTIHVVEIGKTRVRLGIVAPAGTPVHRAEVWLRIRREHEDGAETEKEKEVAARAGVPPDDDKSAPAAKGDDLDASLAEWIATRTGGRISSLSVEAREGRVVVSGSTG
jgi:carbon storage regulator